MKAVPMPLGYCPRTILVLVAAVIQLHLSSAVAAEKEGFTPPTGGGGGGGGPSPSVPSEGGGGGGGAQRVNLRVPSFSITTRAQKGYEQNPNSKTYQEATPRSLYPTPGQSTRKGDPPPPPPGGNDFGLKPTSFPMDVEKPFTGKSTPTKSLTGAKITWTPSMPEGLGLGIGADEENNGGNKSTQEVVNVGYTPPTSLDAKAALKGKTFTAQIMRRGAGAKNEVSTLTITFK